MELSTMESCKRLKVTLFEQPFEKPLLLALPVALSTEIYEYSSPDTFARLALVCREVSSTSQHYRRSDRYAFSLMKRAVHREIKLHIANLGDIHPHLTTVAITYAWMGVYVGDAIINTILSGSLTRVADDEVIYNSGTIIRAARYCAVGFRDIELLWWAAQRENNPDALSLFRAEPLELTAEERMCLQFIDSHPRGIGRYAHNTLQGDTKVVNDYVNSSPRAMWAIVRHAQPEYKLQAVFRRMISVGPCHGLLGIIRHDGCSKPVVDADMVMKLARNWFSSKVDEFCGSDVFKALASCAGTSAEYSEELMREAIGLKPR